MEYFNWQSRVSHTVHLRTALHIETNHGNCRGGLHTVHYSTLCICRINIFIRKIVLIQKMIGNPLKFGLQSHGRLFGRALYSTTPVFNSRIGRNSKIYEQWKTTKRHPRIAIKSTIIEGNYISSCRNSMNRINEKIGQVDERAGSFSCK